MAISAFVRKHSRFFTCDFSSIYLLPTMRKKTMSA